MSPAPCSPWSRQRRSTAPRSGPSRSNGSVSIAWSTSTSRCTSRRSPVPATPERFRLGVNYWPSETAMDWLARYDAAAIRRDFHRIAAVGMDTVRIFLRWEDLQPSPTTIDPAALAAVIDTADAASDAGVELIVTLFTGHMSGVNWIPIWATGGSEGDDRFRVVSGGAVQPRRQVLRSWYADATIIDAQALLADRVAAAL